MMSSWVSPTTVKGLDLKIHLRALSGKAEVVMAGELARPALDLLRIFCQDPLLVFLYRLYMYQLFNKSIISLSPLSCERTTRALEFVKS